MVNSMKAKSDKAAEIIRKFEQITNSKNKNIIWLTYQQGKVLKNLKKT